MNYSFLQEQNNSVIFVGGMLEIYLPRSYFREDQLAEELGSEIKTIGCFVMKYYKDPESTKYETYQLALPENITFTFSQFRENVKETLFESENDEEDEDDDDREDIYNIYTLYENDVFITSLEIVQTYRNTEKFLKLHEKGKLPKTIKYCDFLKLYLENMLTNKTDLRVPSVTIEMTISELARYKKNPEIPFRQVIGKDNTKITELDYKQVSIKELAMLSSTFTAVTSENINKAMLYSVTKTRTGGKEAETPIEPHLKY